MNEIDVIGLESGNIKEQSSEASEEDVARVSENLKKAKQVRGQMQAQQANNNNLALMLSIIINKISDDKILGNILEFMSKYFVDIKDIFSLYIPFFVDEIVKYQLQPLFEGMMINIDSLSEYSDFVSQVFAKSESLKKIPQKQFVQFIMFNIHYLDIGNFAQLIKADEKGEFENQLQESLNKQIYK